MRLMGMVNYSSYSGYRHRLGTGPPVSWAGYTGPAIRATHGPPVRAGPWVYDSRVLWRRALYGSMVQKIYGSMFLWF